MSDFWSRRKARVEAEERAEAEAVEEAHRARAEAEQEARPDELLLAEAGLPEPEAVDSAEMLQAFLRSTLPQRLKRRAMRAHWKTNPVLACLDGLNDYEEDFTTAEFVGEAVRTTYQVGRGLKAHLDEMERAANAGEDTGVLPETEDAVGNETGDMARADIAEGPLPEKDTESDADDAAEAGPEAEGDDDAPVLAATARRMRFRFETT